MRPETSMPLVAGMAIEAHGTVPRSGARLSKTPTKASLVLEMVRTYFAARRMNIDAPILWEPSSKTSTKVSVIREVT